jgi:hypothetical protein
MLSFEFGHQHMGTEVYGCVWFMPRVALPKYCLAKILVDVLLAYELVSIGNHPNTLIFGHCQ